MPELATEGLTREELKALIQSVSAEAMGPALVKAMEPFTKVQPLFEEMLAKTTTEVAIDADLGKFPVGRKVRAIALAALEGHPGDVKVMKAEVTKRWALSHSRPTLKWLDHVEKNLTAGTAASAGDMIFPTYDPEWIQLLRARALVRGIARSFPMPRGATTRRKQTASATAYYLGEGVAAANSQLAVGRANLSFKKLIAITVESNDLIRFSGGESDRIVQEDLLNASAQREDRAFLAGNPPIDAGSPQGILYQTLAGNVFTAAGVTLANYQSDLAAAINLVESSNVPVTSETGYFLMSPATFWFLVSLGSTLGDMVFLAGMLQAEPRLYGFRVLRTSQLSAANLFAWGYGGGPGLASALATSGKIIFVHGPALEIHDSLARTVQAFPGGAYQDATAGVVLSGISQDETVISCIAEHDFFQSYNTAAAVVQGYVR